MSLATSLPSAFSHKDSPLLREFMSKPLIFGPPVTKTSFAPSSGLTEVLAGPPSPPRHFLRLSSQSAKGDGAEHSRGTVNGNGHMENPSTVQAKDGQETGGDVEEKGSKAGRANGNAEAGPSSLKHTATPNGTPARGQSAPESLVKSRQPTPASPSKAASNGPLPTTPGANGSMQDTLQHGPTSTKAPIHLAASRRPHPSNVLCAELEDADLEWHAALVQAPGYGAGLVNPSMACYANSTLQIMVHTPPLVREAIGHPKAEECPLYARKQFCMLCTIKRLVLAHRKSVGTSYRPTAHKELPQIKKGFSTRRQEDAHEFFRFATDALQNQALFNREKKMPDKLKHTSWVHRIWGGRVRSRVICLRCKKPSDTFDDFLDLALDCGKGRNSLDDMLRGFIKEDRLDGDNKYSCENCKQKSAATKSFRIAAPPAVLTLHLKRFSVSYSQYSGNARANKYNNPIQYRETIDLAPYLTDEHYGKSTKYRLFGVTNHHGGSLSSGHYTSYVKSPDGKWREADDESMRTIGLKTVLNSGSAYLLSYIRVTGSEETTGSVARNGTVNGHGKRTREESDEREEESEEDEEPVNKLSAKRPALGPIKPNFGNGIPSLQSSSQTGPSLFSSSFDAQPNGVTSMETVRKADQAPHSGEEVGKTSTTNSPDDSSRQSAIASKFGSSMSPEKSKFNKLGASQFYNQNHHDPHTTSPGKHGSHHSHKQHRHQRKFSHDFNDANGSDRKKSKKDKGRRKRNHYNPYMTGEYGEGGGGGRSGGGGFAGHGKGLLKRMKGRH